MISVIYLFVNFDSLFLFSYQYGAAVNKRIASSGDCEAEQVHVSLGNSLNSVIVNFASETFVSQVYWSTNEADLEVTDWSTIPDESFVTDNTDSGLRMAKGFYRSHSDLYCKQSIFNALSSFVFIRDISITLFHLCCGL